MAVTLNIQADVIDIQKDQPSSSDVFFVDSNVWLWLVYPACSQSPSPSSPYQTSTYPSYIQNAISAQSALFWSGLSFAEISHRIENTEREIYNSAVSNLTAKEYRHNNPQERRRVTAEIKNAWDQVKTLSKPLNILINETLTDRALNVLQQWPLDGYDAFFVETMIENGVEQIITDDGDFSCVPNIKVFTANQNVIQAAQAQKKLVTR